MTSKLSSVVFPGDDGKHDESTQAKPNAPRSAGTLTSLIDSTKKPEGGSENTKKAARFADSDEEIDPIQSLGPDGQKNEEDLSPEAREQIRNLAMTLQKSRLQEQRATNFAYEPVSMPTSRVSPPQFAHETSIPVLTSIRCTLVTAMLLLERREDL